MIRGFFFDLDGTLVNTYEADFLAYRDAISEVAGSIIGREDFETTHGKAMRSKLALLAPDLSEESIQAIAEAKKRHYEKYVHLTEADQALIGFLVRFANQVTTVLVTTAKKDNAMRVLDQHGLNAHFQFMVFGDEVTNPKPDPEPYLLALERSGLEAAEVIAFEDSESGIAAAEAAGIQVVHVGATR